MKKGSSLIDVVISIGIIVILFGGIFLVYVSIINSINSVELRSSAAAVLNQQVEAIRNLPYDNVGTVGGIPTGVIPQAKTVSFGDYVFTLNTVVRNIDDAYDGLLGGLPNDTAPADYKLVEITATCPACQRFTPMALTITVSPKNLESAGLNGSLFINVRDSNGVGVPAATVHVINSNVTPSVDLTDTTNNNGTLQLVGVPTSTQSYQVYISKAGYSSDQTYPLGGPGNPNPRIPYATVGQQNLTQLTLLSDKTSQLTVLTSDDVCTPAPNEPFSIQGTWLIGDPNVLYFSTSTQTSSLGQKVFPALRWDTYALTLNDASKNIVGTIPFVPLVLNPGTTSTIHFILQSSANPSLLVNVKDGAGNGVQDALVHLMTGGASTTLTTGHHFLTHTNWSSGQYSSKSGSMDPDSVPGSLDLLLNASSSYPTSTEWLISNTLDSGSASSTYYQVQWTPTTQPVQTGENSVELQIAANNDNATWNFMGPDGTASTYFTSGGNSLGNNFNNNRYIRYKVYLVTQDENFTPRVNDVSIEFNGSCVPPSQVLFTNVLTGSYTLDVTAAGHTETTSSLSVVSGWQQTTIQMP
jgi:hypothetical protein